jgi:hypothetical protein
MLLITALSLAPPALGQDLLGSRPVRATPLPRYLTEVLRIEFDGSNPYLVVELDHGGMALFRSETGDPWGSQAEVAGYRMSRWLDLGDLVPLTVSRRLGHADFPMGDWPYREPERLGSLQTFLPARPINDEQLKTMPADRKAGIEILSFLMGRYDNHSGNTLVDDRGRIFIVDFENALEHQMVRYGEYPYVRKGQPNCQVPTLSADQPFPFAAPEILRNPSLQELEDHLSPFRAPWSEPAQGLHDMIKRSTDQCLRSVTWEHQQWLQVRAPSRHPAWTECYPPALVERLEALTLETLETEILLPPFTRRHALAIMERRDQVLRAAQRAAERQLREQAPGPAKV